MKTFLFNYRGQTYVPSIIGAHRHIISDMMLNLAKQNLIFVFIKTIFFCAQTLRLLGEFLDLESF